jgi:hopanoid biosynthesis associated RND transporter like protein HpnN
MPLPRLPDITRLIATLAERSSRHALAVVLGGALLAVLAGWLAVAHLGITTDTEEMFAKSLPWRQREIALAKAFPQFQDLLVAVVDGASPEIAEQTARELTTALKADPAHFTLVREPAASPYLEKYGLMFLDAKTLGQVMDRTIDAQPFLGQLVADPSARGLFAVLALMAMGVESGQADLTSFPPALLAFHTALAAALAGHPQPLSWQRLLGGKLVDLAGPYRIVLAKPKLDYGALEPGRVGSQALRAAAAQLEFVRSGQAHVRLTGSVALADEEFATVAQGALLATAASLLLVLLWLVLAVRDWRLILAIGATLGLGLALTSGFAALAVGTLNLISVAFAILFVGIAVDFAIQFCVRYREMQLSYPGPRRGRALHATAVVVGPQVLVAAVAASAGFLAFVPTDFQGVAELGLIAGVGMLIACACTLGFLPAVLTLLRPPGGDAAVGYAWAGRLERQVVRFRAPVLAGFATLGLLGLLLLPHLQFDSDPLHTKDASTEAMRTLADLMANPVTSPYTADILAPNQAAADALAARLGRLKLVDQVVTLSSFVPQDQQAKLPIIADAASILGATLAPRTPAAPVTPGDIRLAARTALAQIDNAADKLAKGAPLALIGDDLRLLATADDATLLAANAALTRFLPQQLQRLRDGLDVGPVTAAAIPPELARDWSLPDGRVRVQAVAVRAAQDSKGLRDFVAEVRSVAPDATGSAVGIVESADTIIGAFRTAAIGALLAIAVLLSLALRRPQEVALTMAALVLSALLTVVVIAALHISLNFANIIALPLLLGVGVSFNIYFVMNWRAGHRLFLGTGTARAILFSALTTATAFGSLAASHHPGTASMGTLLLIALGCTQLVTLIFLPALLARRPDAESRS